ncbi:hypothetical protein [Chryseobacterium sp.]
MKPLLLLLFFLLIDIQSQIKKTARKPRHLNAQKKMVIPVMNDHPEK